MFIAVHPQQTTYGMFRNLEAQRAMRLAERTLLLRGQVRYGHNFKTSISPNIITKS